MLKECSGKNHVPLQTAIQKYLGGDGTSSWGDPSSRNASTSEESSGLGQREDSGPPITPRGNDRVYYGRSFSSRGHSTADSCDEHACRGIHR
ncbi:Protein ALUMINUM SENSITIVE 3 like [Actinidia chinensis var. chinensis]|uniref:Protein ALUMINUM SENSITIVE 3 like n=1 Tax=Actinidia chinensis var. chinensis TaxID=1590841 RepID=A0A2R6PWV4_ACTCC|nr:Protein ALUMINUM SENSITIVE 3 like [Actinidia chinensis var. chinensis]